LTILPSSAPFLLCRFFHALDNGSQWRKLPTHFGNWHTIYVRFQRWTGKGIWQKINETLLAEHLSVIDVTTLSLDSTIVKVHPNGAGAQKKEESNPLVKAEAVGLARSIC